MPDVLHLKSHDWELSVWVKDTDDRLRALEKTLHARGRELPASRVYLSPALAVAIEKPSVVSADYDLPVSELLLPKPLFFENKQYEFEFIFDPAVDLRHEPKLVHRLAAIEDAFHFSKKSRSLRGSVNFANDVGWFRLGICYASPLPPSGPTLTQHLSFEVLPTKMAMDTDMSAIHAVIDAAYPLWRFSFAHRTEQELARSNQRHERFALLWLAHFKQLRTRLEDGVKLVMRAPHARLLQHERVVRLERLRGRMPMKLEARVHAHLTDGETHHRYQYCKRRLSADTTENRFVKMVVRRCSHELGSIIRLALRNQKSPEEGGRLSASFFSELDSWREPLDQMINQPFFTEVGKYEGMERESLVLHQRAGYADVYRIWQELKMYLGLFGQHAAVSMKSVADLYEVWCFLEIKNILGELGFAEQSSAKASLTNSGFEKTMENGAGSAFNLYRAADDLHIRLSHEPSFNRQKSQKAGEIYSWTTVQKPDIFLEAIFTDRTTVRWIFDAKYRIKDEVTKDMAPDDAINQMHRYRDALIHVDKLGPDWKEKSRPVLGAFVLYPGWFEEKSTANPYAKSIEDVGIGAFPLLPNRPNLWLRTFLEKQFSNHSSVEYVRPESDRYFAEDSARITVTGSYLNHYQDLALVAHVAPAKNRDNAYMRRFAEGTAKWYHVPVTTTLKKSISHHVMQETRHCAFASFVAGAKHRILEYIYEVRSIKIVKRSELSLEQAGSASSSTEDYWLIELGPSRAIPQAIVVRNIRKFTIFHTSSHALANSKTWEELPQRYVSLV